MTENLKYPHIRTIRALRDGGCMITDCSSPGAIIQGPKGKPFKISTPCFRQLVLWGYIYQNTKTFWYEPTQKTKDFSK